MRVPKHEANRNEEAISDQLAEEIIWEATRLIKQIPNKITEQNKDKIASICEQISNLTGKSLFDKATKLGIRDYFGSWRMLFIPWWKWSFGWEPAIGDGFTWQSFIDHLLNMGETEIEKDLDDGLPGIAFYNAQGERQAYVYLVHED